jgi:hypothetical protein
MPHGTTAIVSCINWTTCRYLSFRIHPDKLNAVRDVQKLLCFGLLGEQKVVTGTFNLRCS